MVRLLCSPSQPFIHSQRSPIGSLALRYISSTWEQRDPLANAGECLSSGYYSKLFVWAVLWGKTGKMKADFLIGSGSGCIETLEAFDLIDENEIFQKQSAIISSEPCHY